MSRHHSKKADGNQPEIVKILRGLGASFQHTHQIAGALDGIVGYKGVDQRIEIKDPSKPPSARRLTQKEQETFDNWKGRNPVVIETEEDCIKLLKGMSGETITESLSAIKQLPDGEYPLDSTGTLVVKDGKMTVI